MEILRQIGSTIGRVAVLFVAVLLVSALAEDAYLFVKGLVPAKPSSRAALPNYSNKEQARQMFADFKKMQEDYVPFLGWKRRALTTRNVNIDENGWRTHHAGRENNAAGALTIGFFGGSTMIGKGTSDDDTIPAIFDQLTTDFAVTNYGQGGHTARQNLAQLVNLIDTGDMPDVVVFYGGYNHVWAHCNYGVTHRLNGHMAERKLERALRDRPTGGYTVNEIVRPLVARIRRVLGEDRFTRDEFVCDSDPERAQQVADSLTRIWQIAATLVDGFGGRFYAFLQPIAHIGAPRFDHLEVKYKKGGVQFSVVYPLVQAKLAALDPPWFADLSTAFDVDEYLYIDDAHVSRAGNSIIAHRMLERIAATGRTARNRAEQR
jgi:hypothetical protein